MTTRILPTSYSELDPIEIDWLNTYHARVREEMSPLLEERALQQWLLVATAPIS